MLHLHNLQCSSTKTNKLTYKPRQLRAGHCTGFVIGVTICVDTNFAILPLPWCMFWHTGKKYIRQAHMTTRTQQGSKWQVVQPGATTPADRGTAVSCRLHSLPCATVCGRILSWPIQIVERDGFGNVIPILDQRYRLSGWKYFTQKCLRGCTWSFWKEIFSLRVYSNNDNWNPRSPKQARQGMSDVSFAQSKIHILPQSIGYFFNWIVTALILAHGLLFPCLNHHKAFPSC